MLKKAISHLAPPLMTMPNSNYIRDLLAYSEKRFQLSLEAIPGELDERVVMALLKQTHAEILEILNAGSITAAICNTDETSPRAALCIQAPPR